MTVNDSSFEVSIVYCHDIVMTLHDSYIETVILRPMVMKLLQQQAIIGPGLLNKVPPQRQDVLHYNQNPITWSLCID